MSAASGGGASSALVGVAPPPAAAAEGGDPSDWEPFVDDESGDTYFYNHRTMETTWDKPLGVVVQPGKKMARRSMAMDLTALRLKIAEQTLKEAEDVHRHEKRVLVSEVKRNRALLDEKDAAIRDLWAQLDAARLRESKQQQSISLTAASDNHTATTHQVRHFSKGEPIRPVELPSSAYAAVLDKSALSTHELLETVEDVLFETVDGCIDNSAVVSQPKNATTKQQSEHGVSVSDTLQHVLRAVQDCVAAARDAEERQLHTAARLFKPLVAHPALQALVKPSLGTLSKASTSKNNAADPVAQLALEASRQDRALALDPASAGCDENMRHRLRLRVVELEAAFRSALRERLEELKSVDAATLAAKSKLAASRRASARMSAKVSAATAAPIIDDDPAVSAMEKLLKVVRVGAAPVGAFKSAWGHIVAEDRAGCQAYFLQLRDMRQMLEEAASSPPSVKRGSLSLDEHGVFSIQSQADEVKADGESKEHQTQANSGCGPGDRAIRADLDAAAAAIDSAGDAMDVTAPGDSRATAQNEKGEVDELIRSLESDSDDGDGDSADGGDALDQEDDEFSMLTAAATESLEHVQRAINQNETKPVDPDFEQSVANVVKSEGAQYLMIRNALQKSRGTALDAHEKDFVKRYLAELEMSRIRQFNAGRLVRHDAARRFSAAEARLQRERRLRTVQSTKTVVDLYLQGARVKPRFDAFMSRLGKSLVDNHPSSFVRAMSAPRLKRLERVVEQVVQASFCPPGQIPTHIAQELEQQLADTSSNETQQRQLLQQKVDEQKARSLSAHSVAYSAAVGHIRDVVRGRVVMKDMDGIASVLAHLSALDGDKNSDSIELISVEDRFAQTGDRRHAIGGGWRDVLVYFRFRAHDGLDGRGSTDLDHICELQIVHEQLLAAKLALPSGTHSKDRRVRNACEMLSGCLEGDLPALWRLELAWPGALRGRDGQWSVSFNDGGGYTLHENTLTLTYLNLRGKIPFGFSQFLTLEQLNLFHNELTGPLPVEICQMATLTSLQLEGNCLTGPLPQELFTGLPKLTYLNLCENNFTGQIPKDVAKLVNLTGLGLGSNKFTGQIPTEIATLTKLTRLVLRGNLLTGPVPMELAQLTNLTGLALNRNGLTGIETARSFLKAALPNCQHFRL